MHRLNQPPLNLRDSGIHLAPWALEPNKLKGAGALDSLIFKLLINSLTTRFLADPQKNPMDFTWGVLWTHITEHSMSKEEYRNMLAMHGVPLEVFDQDEK